MRHPATVFLLIVSALCLLVLPVQAERVVDVRDLETVDPVPVYVGRAPTQQCVVGNTNPAAWVVGGWFAPPHVYKLVFEPTATCTLCPVEFDVNTVHIVLQSTAACTLIMEVDVENAFVGNEDCPEPGDQVCISSWYQVLLPSSGTWDIGLPIDCHCLPSDWTYLLGVRFDSSTCDLDIVTDNFPVSCTSWYSCGEDEWYDLCEEGFPGNLIIFADAECCEVSASEPITWGRTKGLYR
jgi:hypothetical protein